MKKIIAVILVLLSVAGACSCGSAGTETGPETTAAADEPKTCSYGKIWKLVYFITVSRDEQRAAHVDESGYVTKDPTGGNVYVANPDGSDAHLLYHTDEFITGNTSDMNHPLICGDYFGLPAARFEGDEMFEDRLIIANINTGEYVVTHE